jgi:hypothetical protein
MWILILIIAAVLSLISFVVYIILRKRDDDRLLLFKNSLKARELFTYQRPAPVKISANRPRIVISLSTLPTRIETSLKFISEQQKNWSLKPDAIYLCIPYKSIRLNQKYILPDKIPDCFTVVRCQDDGPATKLLGCIDREEEPDTIIITIDDDILYHSAHLEELAMLSMALPNACVGFSSLTSIMDSLNPDDSTKIVTSPLIYALQGFCGIAYRRKFVDVDFIRYLKNFPGCFVSDDIFLSRSVAMKKADLVVAKPRHFPNSIQHLSKDALSGMKGDDERERVYFFCQRSLIKFEFLTHFIWSKGLYLLADVFSTNSFFFDDPMLPGERNITDGNSVCIRSSFIRDFMKDLKVRVKLITCDSDDTIEPINYDTSNIISWFSQNLNYGGNSPKIRHIPIGVDYHTNYIKNGTGIHPREQDNLLREISENAKPLDKRKFKILCNFHHNISHPSRRELHERFKDNRLFDFQSARTTYFEFWKKATDYVFVLSPLGMGIDCHRTWEALILGCVAIVQSSPIDSLYEDLPVIVITDWNDITQENLVKWRDWAIKTNFKMEKLTTEYWLNEFRNS